MAQADVLWFTDNGAIYCTDHLGASARITGRDISGQKIEQVTVADRLEAAKAGWLIRCESCNSRRASFETTGER